MYDFDLWELDIYFYYYYYGRVLLYNFGLDNADLLWVIGDAKKIVIPSSIQTRKNSLSREDQRNRYNSIKELTGIKVNLISLCLECILAYGGERERETNVICPGA